MSPPNDQRPIPAFELTVGSTGRVSNCTEQLPEYLVAFTQAAAFAFTGTFVIAGTQACPGGKLLTRSVRVKEQRLGKASEQPGPRAHRDRSSYRASYATQGLKQAGVRSATGSSWKPGSSPLSSNTTTLRCCSHFPS
jgi:hypothetical protein